MAATAAELKSAEAGLEEVMRPKRPPPHAQSHLSPHMNATFNCVFPSKFTGNARPGEADSRAFMSDPPPARVCVCVCRTLTGESKEKAHSLLKTLSPVLGTLMVGMYGTSSSPRSVAIFAFPLLAPQCRGATGAALSEERMLFLKHSVSTFLQPTGCDAEKHKNKMKEGRRARGYTGCKADTMTANILFVFFYPRLAQKGSFCADITCLLLTVVTLRARPVPPTSEDDDS